MLVPINDLINNYENHIDENNNGVFYEKTIEDTSYYLKCFYTKGHGYTLILDIVKKGDNKIKTENLKEINDSILIKLFNQL